MPPFVPDEDHYIFVSYSHADRERVFPIITRLYEKGWHVWYDQGIPYGSYYDDVILRHLDNCAVFLLFISDNSVQSEYVSKREVPHACNMSKTIVQCLLDPCACFPDMVQRKLDFATEMEELHPKTNETGLEAVLEKFIQHFEPREAKGFQNKVHVSEIPIWDEDDEYEFAKKPDGICLGKYLGKDDCIIVPAVYKGFPVKELDDTFRGNETVKTVYIPEGIERLSFLAFAHCTKLTDLYLPNSYKENYKDKWSLEVNAIIRLCINVTIHCVKCSDAYYLAKRLKWKKRGLKIKTDYSSFSSLIPCTQQECSYVFCSLTEQDKERLQGILHRLMDLGCTILDSNSLPDSDKLRAFLDARIVLAFVSRAYLSSQESQYLELSCQTGKERIIWLIEECQLPSKLSLFVENEQQIRYDNGTREEQISKLIESLQKKGCITSIMIYK